MHRALFVPDENVLHHVLLKQRVVDRQHRAAGIAENMLDALIGERFDHHLGAGHFGAGFGCGRLGFSDRVTHRRLLLSSWSAFGPLSFDLAFRRATRNSGNKKGASKSPWSRTASFRGWN